ncbi:MAG TPA: PQQ-dependent sugar dehydrogenase [Bryobacteraceae bacterium]|jgi:glucose/arabinose dehydrogenase
MKTRSGLALVLAVTAALAALLAQAQQPADAGKAKANNNSKAPKGIGWPSPALPAGPIPFDTGIARGLSLTITKGLVQPFSMAFLPDGAILITERPGRLRIVRNGVLQPAPVAGLPAVQPQGLTGLMDLALHPRFAENSLIYFSYNKPASTDSKPGNGKQAAAGLTLARGRWNGTAIADFQDLFSAGPNTNASRIIFGRDGMVYMTVGVADPPQAERAQDPNDLAGKVLRLRDDGTVPADNPFVNRAGYRPEIYTMGHRTVLGLTLQPDTGAIWECEDGPNGGDEVNILAPGKNYGWPVVSYGRFYAGPRVSVNPYKEGMEPPVIYWVPAIAVSGLTFYTGDRYPGWKNNLFVGGMREGEVPRSGHFERIDFNDQWEELHREGILRDLHQRIRDIRQGPDGLLYLLTAEEDGALLRIDPAAQPGAR